jgi:hypothetical protein
MNRWRVDDLFRLADAIAAAGLHTFPVRRALQRLERGEISASDAAQLISTRWMHVEARTGAGAQICAVVGYSQPKLLSDTTRKQLCPSTTDSTMSR